MSIIPKIIKKTPPYKFASWLYGSYRREQQRIYLPEQFKEYGSGVQVEHDVYINMPERIVLKDRAVISAGTLINSRGGLHIGENSALGYNCTVFTDLHRYRNAKTIPYENGYDLKPVIIREYVWIGIGVMILPGVEIGEGAIIGMGAVVSKNVPPLAIVMGNPAEVIGYRNKDHYYKCKKEGKFQTVRIKGPVEERMVPMFRIRYEKELKELGMF